MCQVWIQVFKYIHSFILKLTLRGRHIYPPSVFIVEATEAQEKSGDSRVPAGNSEFEPRQCGSQKVLLDCYTYWLIIIIAIVILSL